DGIRDATVTGVQTCALPISARGAAGRLGRKSGRGFYLYKGGKKRGVDDSVYGLLGVHPNGGPRPAEILQRLVLGIVNEAARALGEGVAHSARDGDIGAIFGFGFPPFRRGPPRYAAGLAASLDLLGESVLHADEAQRACRTYLDVLDRIRATNANANVSVKLTQMGLDIDEQLCIANMRAIIGKAKQFDSFVRIDMEQSSY